MPRKKKPPIQENYDSPFPTRLRQLIEESGQTQDYIAKQIEVNRQSIGQWKDGTTAPDIYILVKIANHFEVSADFLVGLTDVKSNRTDIKSVHEKTGLSDMAIENLISENASINSNTGILSQLLEKKRFRILLSDIHNLVNAKIKKMLYDEKFQGEMDSYQRWILNEQEKQNGLDSNTVILNPSDFYDFRENKLKEAFIEIVRVFINSTLTKVDINDFADDAEPHFKDYEDYLKEVGSKGKK